MRIGGVAILALAALSSCGDAPSSRSHQSTPTPGAIAGTVRLSGTLKPLPSDRPGPMVQPGAKPVDPAKSSSAILGAGQTLANVYVVVSSGLDPAKFQPPTSTVLLRQFELVYEPRVVALMTKQKIRVRNDDNCSHNIHITPKHNREFNWGQIKGDENVFRFLKPEIGIPVKCDVHPWKRGWIHVSDHPFFMVTDVHGRFAFDGLPPGNYEIMAWHERFKNAPLVKKVKVEPGMTATLDFTFEAPKP
jgi:hypothetical protein